MQKDAPRDAERAREPSLALGVNRCPFCHTDVAIALDRWVACRQCLARHHEACWSEGARCATCGHDHVLTVVESPGAQPRPALGARPQPSTVQLLGHGLEGVVRLAFTLPVAAAKGLWAIIRLANAWPRLTGVLALLLVVLLLGGRSERRTVVYQQTPVYTYSEPAPAVKTPRQRAREAAARGEFGVARLELERLTRDATVTDATLWEDLGWASLADGLPVSARQAYARAHDLDPSQRRWGEVFSALALRDRASALASLGSSLSVNDPAYRELWRALVSGDRSGLSASSAREGSWQVELVRWGRGEFDDAGLLDAAERWPQAAPTAAERRCEASAYVALAADLRGERELALTHYARAVDTSVFSYIEHVWASARLRALQGGGPLLGPEAPVVVPAVEAGPDPTVPPIRPPAPGNWTWEPPDWYPPAEDRPR
jgi:hypothetical protein